MAVVGWLLAIGTVWGITNALIKRGALIAEQAKRTTKTENQSGSSMVGSFFGDWIRLLCVWQYSLPFLLNLSMSVLFVIKLGDSPITLAVPVTNATTFAVTAIAGAALGEKMRPLETLVGVALIVAGVTLCISPPVAEVFYYAQKAILHPTAPLFDQETQTLKPRCVRALTRIFILCDHDRDGTLNDAELNDFQMKCFNAPLQPSEVVGVKKVVSEKMAEGVSNDGLTLTGFLFLHALFIERGRLETTWTVLRKFGYDDEIKLRDDLVLNPSFKRAPDQVLRNQVFRNGISSQGARMR